MRKMICTLFLGITISTNLGCLIPIYSGDPTDRARQLLFSSEDLRQLLGEWERMWFLDMPSHVTPHRTHGGIL